MLTPDNHPSQTPLRSQYADDPEMSELVELFVSELPARVNALTAAYEGRQAEQIYRLSHQLKGACAGYGFPTIGVAAAAVEAAVKASAQSADASLESIRSDLEALIKLCQRAAA
jgi:HPt (histidine-containing phosphotransfer) domain-containing protein